MQYQFRPQFENYVKDRSGKAKWHKLVFVMSVFVVLYTFYALLLPAITMEQPKKILNCPLEVHQHEEACYAQGNEAALICGKADYVLHTHEEMCYDQEGFLVCALTETADGEVHIHEDVCFDEADVLICEKQELTSHVHDDACFVVQKEEPVVEEKESAQEEAIQEAPVEEPEVNLAQEDWERIDYVISLIEKLPSNNDVDSKLTAFDDAGDMDGYEAYYKDVYHQTMGAYVYYEDLGEDLQQYVTNKDKLYDLEWIWSVSNYAIFDEVDVYQVNAYNLGNSNSNALPVTVSGGVVKDVLATTMDFKFWYVFVIDKNEYNKLYVKEIITHKESKAEMEAPANGFLLLVHDSYGSINAKEDDIVTTDFDYTAKKTYTGSVLGTVAFSNDGTKLKQPKDNTSKLHIVESADTDELIEVNLYDYNDAINNPYNGNNNYPGFQQDYGTLNVGSSFNSSSFNFGNNITANLAAGIPGITTGKTNINATTSYGAYGTANVPLSDKMMKTLKDGYPALADGTSLQYLFTDNSGYAVKQNSANINGLFIQNDETGEYHFNSRENHAQFNAANNTFTLYKEMISSNFMMYPFGNFLPFNDIVHLSAQTSTIDRAYLQEIADSAEYKQENGYSRVAVGGSSTPNEYGELAIELNKFIAMMDAKHGTDWVAADCMNDYFATVAPPPTFTQDDPLLQKIYSIDYDEETNFFFGMDMKMQFIQPKDGLTGKTGKEPMKYYFTGDDDVWVYIDDVLFLDLSGIHRHVGGEIDFVNGEVHYYGLDIQAGDVATTPYKTVSFAEILEGAGKSTAGLNSKGAFENYSTHTFNFYYMERGAGSGVCRMNFNMPLLRENSISVTKELAMADGISAEELLGNPDFQFQLWKDNGSEVDELLVGEGVSYDVYDSAGNKVDTGKTGAEGVFSIKANQTAVFDGFTESNDKFYARELLDGDVFAQYGTIHVNGTAVQEDTYTKVVISEESFTGVDSPSKVIGDGNMSFTFVNTVTRKTGSLEIEKVLRTYESPEPVTGTPFTFGVSLDNVLLPVGTKYTVTDGATTDEKTVEQAGMVIVPSGSKAVISSILAGSRYTVKELNTEEYRVSYAVNGGDPQKEPSEGMITADTKVSVLVNNKVGGAVVTLPVKKIWLDGDGSEKIFDFNLIQIDEDGTKIKDVETKSIHIPADATEGESAFSLVYLQKDYSQLPQTLHYEIREQVDENNLSVAYDTQVYHADVTLKEVDGEFTAEAVIKNEDGTAMNNAAFENRQLYDLTITKSVEGLPSTEAFTFEITLSKDGSPVTGTFSLIKGAASEDVTFDAEGTARITLKDKEQAVLHGLAVGTVWTVEETESLDYAVKYTIGEVTAEGDWATQTISNGENRVDFTNYTTYVLPETGGSGTGIYKLSGLLLMVGATLICLKRRKGRDAY